MAELPKELLAALEQGELSLEQLRGLIALEAEAVGLSLEDAVRRAHDGTLPKNHIGADLELLIELLPAAA